jgi:hypothetical protein
MPTDLEMIKQLQKKLGIKLEKTDKLVRRALNFQLPFGLMKDFDILCFQIGLSLFGIELKNIPRTIFKFFLGFYL